MMSTTPYQGSGADATEAPLTRVVTAAASISSRASTSTRRRKSPSSPTRNLSLPLPLSTDIREESSSPTAVGNGNDESPPSSLGVDEHHPTMREMICNFIFGKSKALVFGQLLSLVLAGTGAIQSALYLDCHLSAPTFSMLSFYFPLSIICLARLIWKERDHKLFSRQQTSLKSLEQDGSSTQQQENDGLGHETSDPQNVTQQPSESKREISTIRAIPEKRNHLLSRWSHYPPSSLEITEDNGSYVDGNDDVGSNDVANDQTSSKTKSYSFFGLVPLQSSLRMYAAIAVIDVYANYTTILAFKYTTITSASLFDALAIPSAITVSRIFFGRRYTTAHLLGVMVCSIGIALNVLQDYRENKHLEEVGNDEESAQEQLIKEDYPHKIRGDMLAIIGGILFGVSNTLQEVIVRDVSLTEFLGCMTFFASIISFIQVLILERDDVMAFFSQSASDTCTEREGLTLFFAFAVGGMVNYTGISAFLQVSDAAFLNLNLLTGDAWAVAFSVFAEGIVPPASFYVALIITVSGVFIYETAPSPAVDSQPEFIGEIQLTKTVVCVSTGEEELNEQEGHVLI